MSEQKQDEKRKWYKHTRPIVGMAVISLLICGLFFPLLITGIAQVTMPYQANGELAQVKGQTVGSYLIDNNFTEPFFFHARPANESASGVDPDITISDANSQVPGISASSGIPEAALFKIISSNEEGTFWIFGSPYVDVLRLNLVLINDYQNLTVYQGYPMK